MDKARKSAKTAGAVPIARGLKDSGGLLFATSPKLRLADLIVPDEVKRRLERVIREQRHLAKLKNHGLSPRRKLLLVGPPGTGKTFTASILAGELGYPLFQVCLDALITKFMGESSAKLRQVFDAMSDVRGVYFFDEFDALGSQRTSPNDVGKARRILNSFLQMIEQDDSNSVIVCATNQVEVLDPALFHRLHGSGHPARLRRTAGTTRLGKSCGGHSSTTSLTSPPRCENIIYGLREAKHDLTAIAIHDRLERQPPVEPQFRQIMWRRRELESFPRLMRETDYHTLAPFVPAAALDDEIRKKLDPIAQTADQARPRRD